MEPSLQAYDKALILGATTQRMQMRLDYLKQIWNQECGLMRSSGLLEKALDPKIDNAPDWCKTESDAAQLIWEEAVIPLRNAQPSRLPLSASDEGGGGNLKRPNTEDTLIEWLKTSPKSRNLRILSDHPLWLSVCRY